MYGQAIHHQLNDAEESSLRGRGVRKHKSSKVGRESASSRTEAENQCTTPCRNQPSPTTVSANSEGGLGSYPWLAQCNSVKAPHEVSHYRIIQKLSEGGMGVVYRAEDTKLGRPVALKFLVRERAGKSKEIKRLKAEARAAASLNHPNICTIYDIGMEDRGWFVVMEYLEGKTLAEVVKGEALPLNDVLEYAIQTCEALAAAHKQGIVHRDIKPANLFVTKDKHIKLLDFGLSRATGSKVREKDPTDRLGQRRSVSGTLQYMSPEQARGLEGDNRSDIFSFGAVFYHLATSFSPFEGDSVADVVIKIIAKEPIPIGMLRPDVPTSFETLIHKCLEKKPELRCQSIEEVLDHLKPMRRFFPSLENLSKRQHTSVAVLPFVNLSNEANDQSLCQSIEEGVALNLSRVGGFSVTSPWWARGHGVSQMDIRRMARDAGVDLVVEGTLQRVGSNIRITSEVTSVLDGSPIWIETFDRESEHLFAVEDEIAVATAKALQCSLTASEEEPLHWDRSRSFEPLPTMMDRRTAPTAYDGNERWAGYPLSAVGGELESAVTLAKGR